MKEWATLGVAPGRAGRLGGGSAAAGALGKGMTCAPDLGSLESGGAR
jgi:hypothetical protein